MDTKLSCLHVFVWSGHLLRMRGRVRSCQLCEVEILHITIAHQRHGFIRGLQVNHISKLGIRRQPHRHALIGVLSVVTTFSSVRFCPWEAPAPGATLVLAAAAWCEHPGQQSVRCVRGKKRRRAGLPVRCLCL